MVRFGGASSGLGVLLALTCAGACQKDDPAVTGAVVLGVQTDLRTGVDFDQLDVALTVNGQARPDKVYSGAELVFPLEIRVDDLKDGESVEAKLTAKASGAAVVERDARTTAVSGRTVLYKIPISAACERLIGPSCASGQTCSEGACAQSFVDGRSLPAYTSTWAKGGPSDICKMGDDAAMVTVGEGQADYLPLSDMQVVQVEAGPQGGYHVWMAARLRGLHQSGSVTTITGSIPALGYQPAATSVIFTFDADEGGYCKIYGLRFRLDDDEHPVADLLGKELDVNIDISDSDGTSASGTQRLMLSNDIE